MVLHIKNMVCVRCKMAVQSVLESLQIGYTTIELGKVNLAEAITPEQQKSVNTALKRYELELMQDRKKILVEQVKTRIIALFHASDDDRQVKLSEYLSKGLYYDYTYLANTFSEVEGSTIERFYIVTRIERVKELIVYEGLSITEIAYHLNYSSVSHLCLQFKKVTGLTPSVFKKRCESGVYVWKTCE